MAELAYHFELARAEFDRGLPREGGMLSSANALNEGRILTADVCIAGAGAAGITLALELVDSGLDVCLLGGGGLKIGDTEQKLYEGRLSGLQTITLHGSRARAFGGTTHLWEGWCRPRAAEDFEPRDYIPYSGWPLDLETLEPFYRRAHGTLQLGVFDYDPARLSERSARPLLEFPGGDVRTEMYQYSPPTRMGSRYRGELEGAANVTAWTDAHLIDIEHEGPRVTRFACGTLDGKRFSVEAERFVLALGGLENARMLLAAGDGAGVANSSDLVGRCFMEHPHYYRSAAIVSPRDIDTAFYERFEADTRLSEDDPAAIVDVMGVLALSPEAREREGLPMWLAQVVNGPVADADEDRTGDLGPLGVAQLLRDRSDPRLLTVTCRVEQTPDPDSRVTLMNDRDALGIPRLDLDWRIREEDDRALVRALELMGAEVAAAGYGRVWIPTRGDAFDWAARGGAHHMGTTRMADDPEHGVVDADGLCFDLDNLYVAGCSVFPTSGASNPTLTIVALAHRLADHLKEEE